MHPQKQNGLKIYVNDRNKRFFWKLQKVHRNLKKHVKFKLRIGKRYEKDKKKKTKKADCIKAIEINENLWNAKQG